MLFLKVGAAALEPGQEQKAGLIQGPNPPWAAPATGGKVGIDPHDKGLDLPIDGHVGGGGATVYQPLRTEEQQVAHTRSRRLLHQRRDLGSHALERTRGGEQGKENLRSHKCSIARLAAKGATIYIV